MRRDYRSASDTADPSHARVDRHAIVVGGSMGGLLAVRVLAKYFDHVTLLERDRFPNAPAFRKGVPQSRHVHVLLLRGAVLLEQLFPGLETELRAAGAEIVEWPADVLWLSSAGWGRRFSPGRRLLCCSRELLEWSLRRRVAELANVMFVEERDVTGLLCSSDQRAVVGVQVQVRPGADGQLGRREALRADLVVDASGRNSRAPEWLAALGYPSPPEKTINPYLGYASRTYARPERLGVDWKLIFLQAHPPLTARIGALLPIEGGRWLVTLAGYGRDYPPTDDAGFLDFARSLRSPILYEAIKSARPLSPVFGYRRTENLIRHYDRPRRWPERFVVVGDAVAAFNPIYGQGMTVAAEGAAILNQCLQEWRAGPPKRDVTGLARCFQRRLARTTATAWLLATGEDFRFPTTGGGRPGPLTRLMHRYLDRLLHVATDDRTVHLAFLDVAHLLAPPTSLFRPDILLRVLLPRRAHGLGQPPTAARVGGGRGTP